MKKSPLARLNALEAQLRPLEQKLAALQSRRTETNGYYQQATRGKRKSEVAKFDRALTDIAVEIAAVEGELAPLQRSYRRLQATMQGRPVPAAA